MTQKTIYGVWDSERNEWWSRPSSYSSPYKVTWTRASDASSAWNNHHGATRWHKRRDPNVKAFHEQTRFVIYEVGLKPLAPYVNKNSKFEIFQISDLARTFGRTEAEIKVILARPEVGMLFRQRA